MKKALYVVMILALLSIAMPVYANNQALDLSLTSDEDMNQNIKVQISSLQAQYKQGDTVQLEAYVKNGDDAAYGINPTLTIVDEYGYEVYTGQWSDNEIGTDGKITDIMKLAADVVLGKYTVTLQAMTEKAVKSFTVVEHSGDPDPDPGNPSNPGNGGGGNGGNEDKPNNKSNKNKKDDHVTVITNKELKEALKNAKDDEYVSLELHQASKNQLTWELKMDASLFGDVQEQGKALKMHSDGWSITLPNTILQSLSMEKGEICFEVQRSEPPKGDQYSTWLSQQFSYNVKVIDGNKNTAITSFTDKVMLEIELNEEVQDNRKASAFYYNEETKEWEYYGGVITGDSMTFYSDHFSSFAVMEKDKKFDDMKDHWAADSVEVLAARTIISGMPNGQFEPESSVTRAQFTTMLARALMLKSNENISTFQDVNQDFWAANQIEAAYREGIINGYSEGQFAPDEWITREQMAVMAMNAFGYRGGEVFALGYQDVTYSDADMISDYALQSIASASQLGILQGDANQRFMPQEQATRAQAATVLTLLLQKLGEF
ncbi:S-layer homology domain-containing protein [Longirhabdus pacifica]|uniref:S-layer homology domain-containing protein n=1 Tax=Longirhabdus pacifica TaxID=2305227 RepID=UPI0013E8B34B|nr:S-layer homology domain-containing protein [Longirhabdus pacifica]